MSVIVNHEPFDTDTANIQTIGQLLDAFRASNTFVVQLLIDGQQPDTSRLDDYLDWQVDDHTIFLETGDPRQLVLETLDEVSALLDTADGQRMQTAALLGQGDQRSAMQQLASCFQTWHIAHDSVIKTVQLLQLDLNEVQVGTRPLIDILGDFSSHLNQLRDALQQHDYVTLSDILTYEMTDTTPTWSATIDAVRRAAA